MARYFIELAYLGTAYAGFQKQQNANTIQAEIEKALHTYLRRPVELTSSSRTDAGVHAAMNFFHFDDEQISTEQAEKMAYHLNALLPHDISVQRVFETAPHAHCRFDAKYRLYIYSIHRTKDPFVYARSFFFPYSIDIELMQAAAALLLKYTNYQSFSKKHTNVFTYECKISLAEWRVEGHRYFFEVKANRFLRGMVKGLVGTMLRVGRGKYSLAQFEEILKGNAPHLVDFSVRSDGLRLEEVGF